MTTNFPTSLDNFTNPTSGSSLASPSHADQHADANDAIEALEAKVGINTSAVTTSLDFRIRAVEAFLNFGFVSGTYHTTAFGLQASSITNQTLSTQNRAHYVPMFIGTQTTFDRIAISTGTNFSGSGVMRLGIYNNANGAPSSLVLDAGTISPVASSTVYPITINQTLSVGWYWLAVVPQTVATTSSVRAVSPIVFMPTTRVPATGAWEGRTVWIETGVTGALPSTATPAEFTTSSSMPLIGLRAA
jgi:hypothetical protein